MGHLPAVIMSPALLTYHKVYTPLLFNPSLHIFVNVKNPKWTVLSSLYSSIPIWSSWISSPLNPSSLFHPLRLSISSPSPLMSVSVLQTLMMGWSMCGSLHSLRLRVRVCVCVGVCAGDVEAEGADNELSTYSAAKHTRRCYNEA